MTLATDIINDARTYADRTFSDVSSLVDSAANRIGFATPSSPEVSVPDYNIDDITWDKITDFNGSYTPPINRAVKPQFQGVTLPSELTNLPEAPVFDSSKLWEGVVPAYNVPDFTKDAPTVNQVSIPDAPVLKEVPFPDIKEVPVPEFNGITLPTFDAQLLTPLPDNPEDVANIYERKYKEALPEMQAFLEEGAKSMLSKYCPEFESNRNNLMARIQSVYDGGTGLSETFEQNLYDRGRSRAEEEHYRMANELLTQSKARGFYVPDGAVIAGLAEIQANTAMTNAQYASETTIERAKLELDHLQFVMQLSDSIRNSALQLFTQQEQILQRVNETAITHAKTVANLVADLFNMRVELFNKAMDYMRVQAEVYETEYKAAMADLEVYKIEAEVASLKSDLNQQEIDLYKARVSAQEQTINIYIAQLKAINSQVNAEKTQVEAFSQEVNAYISQVKAKNMEFDAYNAALQGNRTQVDIYATQVQAYSAQVDTEKAKVGIEIETARAVNEYNRSLIDQYQAELSAYTAEIGAESTRFSSDAEAYKSKLEAFSSELTAKTAKLNGQVSKASLDVKTALTDYTNTANFRIAWAKSYTEGTRNIADVTLKAADVYTDIAAAALNAQNTMVQVTE